MDSGKYTRHFPGGSASWGLWISAPGMICFVNLPDCLFWARWYPETPAQLRLQIPYFNRKHLTYPTHCRCSLDTFVFHETNIAPQKMPSPKGSTSCSKHQFWVFFPFGCYFSGRVPTWSKRFSMSPRRQNVGETGCGHLYRDLKHCAHWAFGRWVGFAQGVEGSRCSNLPVAFLSFLPWKWWTFALCYGPNKSFIRGIEGWAEAM